MRFSEGSQTGEVSTDPSIRRSVDTKKVPAGGGPIYWTILETHSQQAAA